MGGAEFQTVMGPMDGMPQGVVGIEPQLHQPGHLADLAVRIILMEGALQAGKDGGPALVGIFGDDLDLDARILPADGKPAQPVAADQRLAGAEVEFPIVPVAGEDAGGRAAAEAAFAQGIAFMGASVDTGEQSRRGIQQQDLATFMPHHQPARRRQIAGRRHIDPCHATLHKEGGCSCWILEK
jgi:hypothetical protein